MGQYFEQIGGTILFVAIFFLIIRELPCWYWKINERVELLKEIRDCLKGESAEQRKAVESIGKISPKLQLEVEPQNEDQTTEDLLASSEFGKRWGLKKSDTGRQLACTHNYLLGMMVEQSRNPGYFLF